MDLGFIENLRETGHIEAKLALGGLPESIWESYSAFANAEGGLILLGVEELPDRSLRPIKLPYPEELLEEFLQQLNDGITVSANILSPADIEILRDEHSAIIIIRVPKADPAQKPVYIGSDPYCGSYRRVGEGDYKIPHDEVEKMLNGKK